MMQSRQRFTALSYHADVTMHAGELSLRAVFERAWHLATEAGEIITVTAARHNGPLAVRMNEAAFRGVSVSPGDRGRIVVGSGGEEGVDAAAARGRCEASRSLSSACGFEVSSMILGANVVELAADRSWRPDWCGLVPLACEALAADLAMVCQGVVEADRGGIAIAVLDGVAVGRTPVWLRWAWHEVRDLERALQVLDVAGIRARVTGLVGLGPGLTPAGDDLLCGLLVGLRVLGDRTSVHRLRCAASRTAITTAVGSSLHRTTALSRTLLRYAGRGVATEPLLRFLRSIGAGCQVESVRRYESAAQEMDQAVSDLLRIGHSSGSDMLAGAVLAARTITAWEEASAPALVHTT